MSKPFFATVEPLATGLPTIEHYHLGHLTPAAFRSRFAHVAIFDSRGSIAHQRRVLERHVNSPGGSERDAAAGSCIEVNGQSAVVLFSERDDFRTGEVGDGLVVSFAVRLEQIHNKATPPKSTQCNL